MQTFRDDYFTAYRSLKLTRDAEGVLVVQFHNNGGPLTFTAEAHTEVVDAFYRISQDRANKIVILTGAGGDFMIGVDWQSFKNVSAPVYGARSMTKAFRFWKTWPIYVCQSSPPSRDAPISIRSTRCSLTLLWRPRARTSRTQAISPRVSCPVTASLPAGVIAPERDGPRHSCRILSLSPRVLPMNGAWLPKSFRTVTHSAGRASWPRFT